MATFLSAFLRWYTPADLPADEQALPLLPNDPLWLQTALPTQPLPEGSYAVDLVEPTVPGRTAISGLCTARIDALGRSHLNEGGAPLADLAGVSPDYYRLLLRLPGGDHRLSNLFEVLHELPYSALVRFRGTAAGTLFDYTNPATYQQLRLPLRIDQPLYRIEENFSEDGLTLLFTRLVKHWALETDYLHPTMMEPLQLAFRHEVFQVYDPAAQSWDSLAPVGELTAQWQGSPHQRRARVTGTLLSLDTAILLNDYTQSGTTPRSYNQEHRL